MCTRPMGQKSLQDRTQDCLYETWVGDGNDWRKENTRETMLTTSGMQFFGAPTVFVLECVVIRVLLKKS
jgi:hypothetical protein